MTGLAILGGEPAIPDGLHRPYPPVGAPERERVLRALDSGTLWGPWAPMTRELEKRWAVMVGTRHAVALSTGTAALHCALLGCGVGPGDEVIVPAFSFIASASAVLMAAAIPIFADVEPESGNIDAALLDQLVTSRTRAIIAVHLHGLPADLRALQELARRHRIALIEDCAQAHGASYEGRVVGSIGEVGIFSLNATKTLAGPEGGLLTTNSDAIYNEVARTRVFGTEWREGERITRDADSLGYNYRTNELAAAFALARLDAFDEETHVRRANGLRLAEGLRDLPGVSVPHPYPERTHIFQMFRVRLNAREAGMNLPDEVFRERVVAALVAEGARWWVWERKSLPEYELFRTRNAHGRGYPWSISAAHRDLRYDPSRFPVSVATARDAIFTYGHYPQNDPELVDHYVQAFRKVWRDRHALAGIEVLPQAQNF